MILARFFDRQLGTFLICRQFRNVPNCRLIVGARLSLGYHGLVDISAFTRLVGRGCVHGF